MAAQQPKDNVDSTSKLNPYITLLSVFVEGRMDPTTFDREFVATYAADPTAWPDEEASVLEGVLAAAEDFDADPELRAELDVVVDAEELRRTASLALKRLRDLSVRRASQQ